MNMIETLLSDQAGIQEKTYEVEDCVTVRDTLHYDDTLTRKVSIITPDLRKIINALGVHPLSLWEQGTTELLKNQPDGVKALIREADKFNTLDKRLYHYAIEDNTIVLERSQDEESAVLQDHERVVFICNDIIDIPTLMEEVPYEVVKYNLKLLKAL